ncbi:MAG TPA: UPF0147 family protein [Candidatus Binatia bacterium]|nr:UPF0147 family protein [Candidatus Binatia bacterium]
MDSLMQALVMLRELEQDSQTPKNAKAKINGTIKLLEARGKMDISKALNDLESLSDDVNIPAHMRTQLFSVVSLLEIV